VSLKVKMNNCLVGVDEREKDIVGYGNNEE